MIELLHIDSYEYLRGQSESVFDLMIQDTPFGVTQNKWDVPPNLNKMWPEWLRCGKDNCAYIFFATQPFASDLINSNRKLFRYDLIWYKRLGTGFFNAKKMPLRSHESILVFYKKLPTYNPQIGIGVRKKGKVKNQRTGSNYGKFTGEIDLHEYDDEGKRYPQSVLDFSNANRLSSSNHPTPKPVDLFRYLIRTYSNPGDLVFDGYSGGGTTAIAAYLENRNAILCEIEKSYHEDALIRFKKETKQQLLFENKNVI